MEIRTENEAGVWPPSPFTTTLTQSEPDTPPPSRGVLTLIGLSLFATTFGNDQVLGRLPLQFLLKNHLHVSPVAMSGFFVTVGIAWYFKPLAGILSDSLPLGGTRRRSYLLLSFLGAALLWALMGWLPRQYSDLLWLMALVNAFVVVASSVTGGLLVEAGQRSGLTGRLSAIRSAIMSTTTLISGPLGGYLAMRAFGWTCGTGAMLFLLMVPAVALLLPEPRVATRDRGAGARMWAELRTMFGSRPLWIAVVFLFLVSVAPGFNTPLFYYQTNVLHFSSLFIGGILSTVANLAGIGGALLYGLFCARVPLRWLLVLCTGLGAVGALCYLGYSSHTAAIAIETINGLCSGVAVLVLYDLAARATPRGAEALAYSLMMSAMNLALQFSDLFGSWLYDAHHVPFLHLVWLNAGTTALCLLLIPLIPRAIIDRPDGHR